MTTVCDFFPLRGMAQSTFSFICSESTEVKPTQCGFERNGSKNTLGTCILISCFFIKHTLPPTPTPPNTHTHTNTHMYAHSNMWCFLWKSHSTWHCTSHTQLPSTTQAATSAIVSLRVVTFWHTARATAPVTHHLHQWIWYWYWYSGRQTRQLAAALGGVSRWGRGGGCYQPRIRVESELIFSGDRIHQPAAWLKLNWLRVAQWLGCGALLHLSCHVASNLYLHSVSAHAFLIVSKTLTSCKLQITAKIFTVDKLSSLCHRTVDFYFQFH